MNKSLPGVGSPQNREGLGEWTEASAYLPSLQLAVLTDRAPLGRLGHAEPNAQSSGKPVHKPRKIYSMLS